MKGRDLIKFILDNKLEDVDVFDDGFLGFPTAQEVAVKLEVGLATIRALMEMNKLDGIVYDGVTYIFPDSLQQLEDSREVDNAK